MPRDNWGPIIVGLHRWDDETGLSWISVVAANEHGDCVFHVLPMNGTGTDVADALANHLVDLFDVLGLNAKRGEVGHP